jgi:hypothetical protein
LALCGTAGRNLAGERSPADAENVIESERTDMAKAKKAAKKKSAARKTAMKKSVKRSVKATPPARKRRTAEFTVRTGMEITAMFPDTVGLTAQVAAAVAGMGVNILAATGYSASGLREKATFTLVVDDYAKAEQALLRIGANEIHESTVLLVVTPNRVGALERIAKLIADAGINIFYFYATTSSGDTATTVMKTADDARAIKVLQKV